MVNLGEIVTQSKYDSALRLNHLEGIFATAFIDFEKFMSDAGLVVSSHDKHNIERVIQERPGQYMCRPYYLDTRHTGFKSFAGLPVANTQRSNPIRYRIPISGQ